MIVLNLSCPAGHRFEGWFASRAAFEAQREAGQVVCTCCASVQVSALPSGPRVLRHATQAEAGRALPETAGLPGVLVEPATAPAHASPQAFYRALMTMARQAENVGERFAAEVRAMHYDEIAPRAIRGTADAQEVRELLAEGVAVLPLPPGSDGPLH